MGKDLIPTEGFGPIPAFGQLDDQYPPVATNSLTAKETK